jgi:hypothetical protein
MKAVQWESGLDCAAAGAAEMATANAQSATLATKSAGASHRHHAHRNRPGIGCTSPNQASDPSNHRPAKKQVHDKDQSSVVLIAANDCREEVHQDKEQKEKHGMPLSTLQTAKRYS